MTDSQFLCVLGHIQIIIMLVSSGFIAGMFGVLAAANLFLSVYYSYKEDQQEKKGTVSVSPVVVEKETV